MIFDRKKYKKIVNLGSTMSYNHCFGRSEHTMWNVSSGLLNWTTLCHFTSILLIINKQFISMVDIWVSQCPPPFLSFMSIFLTLSFLGVKCYRLSFWGVKILSFARMGGGGSPMTTFYLKRSKILISFSFSFSWDWF